MSSPVLMVQEDCSLQPKLVDPQTLLPKPLLRVQPPSRARSDSVVWAATRGEKLEKAEQKPPPQMEESCDHHPFSKAVFYSVFLLFSTCCKLTSILPKLSPLIHEESLMLKSSFGSSADKVKLQSLTSCVRLHSHRFRSSDRIQYWCTGSIKLPLGFLSVLKMIHYSLMWHLEANSFLYSLVWPKL